MEDKQVEKGLSAGGVVFVAALVVMTLYQGGYYGFPANLLGCLLCVVALVTVVRSRSRRMGAVPLLLFALACSYLVSAFVNGATLTTLGETGTWFAVAAAATFGNAQGLRSRTWVLDALCWVMAGCAVLALLIYVHAVPWTYGESGERLQFPFQYANTAAVWFGAGVSFCLFASTPALRALVPLPLTAALLTKSGGGLLVLLTACLCVVCAYMAKGRWWRVFAALLQSFVALVSFALVDMVGGPWAACGAIVILVGAVALYRSQEARLMGVPWARPVSLGVLALICVLVMVMLALYSGRLTEAFDHIVARLIYMEDAIRVTVASPVVGVGPDNWQYVYPGFQSAQYITRLVHNSYLQAACDAGLFAFVFLLAACVVGIRNLVRQGDARCAVPALLVCVHSVIDFDLQFCAMAALLGYLLSASFEATCSDSHSVATAAGVGEAGGGRKLPVVACVLSLLACLCGLAVSAQWNALTSAASSRDDEGVKAVYQGNPLAFNDIGAREAYLMGLYAAGSYDDVVASYSAYGVSSYKQAMYVSWSLAATGSTEEGFAVLLHYMEALPYSPAVFRAAGEYAQTYGVPQGLEDRYVAAVAHANELTHAGNAALLNDQVEVEALGV